MRYRSPKAAATVTMVGLGFYSLGCISVVASMATNIAVTTEIIQGGPYDDVVLAALDQRAIGASSAWFLPFVITAIAFLVWMTRLRKNVEDTGQEIGWAGLWFFIPFANLYMPLKAMRKLWDATEPAGGHERGPGFLTVWWALYLFMNLGHNLDRVFGTLDSFEQLRTYYVYLAVQAVIMLIAAVACLVMVRRVTNAHHAYFSESGTRALEQVFE